MTDPCNNPPFSAILGPTLQRRIGLYVRGLPYSPPLYRGLRRRIIYLSEGLRFRVFAPSVGLPQGVRGVGIPIGALPSPPPWGWSTGFMAIPRVWGRLPIHRSSAFRWSHFVGRHAHHRWLPGILAAPSILLMAAAVLHRLLCHQLCPVRQPSPSGRPFLDAARYCAPWYRWEYP